MVGLVFLYTYKMKQIIVPPPPTTTPNQNGKRKCKLYFLIHYWFFFFTLLYCNSISCKKLPTCTLFVTKLFLWRLLPPDRKSTTDQRTDKTKVQFSEPLSFIGATFRNLGEMLLRNRKYSKTAAWPLPAWLTAHKAGNPAVLCTTFKQLSRLECSTVLRVILSTPKLLTLGKRKPCVRGQF